MIKDAKGRYKNNPLSRDGWGCALYKADSPDTQVGTDYKKDVWAATCPESPTIGFTSRVIPFSIQSKK